MIRINPPKEKLIEIARLIHQNPPTQISYQTFKEMLGINSEITQRTWERVRSNLIVKFNFTIFPELGFNTYLRVARGYGVDVVKGQLVQKDQLGRSFSKVMRMNITERDRLLKSASLAETKEDELACRGMATWCEESNMAGIARALTLNIITRDTFDSLMKKSMK